MITMRICTYGLIGLMVLHATVSLADTSRESLESFRNTMLIPALSLTVPTVVELPVTLSPDSIDQFAVYELNSSTYIPHYMHTVYTVHPTPQSASVDGRSVPALTDGGGETHIDFPVLEQEESSVRITLDASTPITSSLIVLGLDPYVALPTRIGITVNDAGNERVVVAPTPLFSTTISFPETSATSWTVTLFYVQPLRMHEVRLIETGVAQTVNHGLRFLAQPGYSYQVYTQPDRFTSVPTGESGNLRDDTGVLTLMSYPEIPNSEYRQADSDSDGVADLIDNCVSISNTDQIDIDRNKKGDACDDYDRDGLIEGKDNCPTIANRTQADEDGDGMGDACDNEESRVTEKYPWIPWAGMGIAVLVIGALFVLVGVAPKHAETT